VSCGEVLGPVVEVGMTFEGVNEPQMLLHVLAENDECFRLVYIESWCRCMAGLHVRL